MKTLAERDGREFGDINSRPLGALDLEHILMKVARIAVRRKLYEGYASIVERHFGKGQQRLLFYMMSEIVRADRCKHRSHLARSRLVHEWPERQAKDSQGRQAR
jgi:hypothetical protein